MKTKFVKVIYGGYGCRIADGIKAKIISKPKEEPEIYSGESLYYISNFFVKDKYGHIYALCEGFKIKYISIFNFYFNNR